MFKKTNDNFGHSAGDKVLEDFWKTCKELTRKKDIIGRIGGEEFCFFLTSTCLYEAKEFSEKLLKEVNKTKTKYGNIEITFTASIGVLENNSDQSLSLDEVINQAD